VKIDEKMTMLCHIKQTYLSTGHCNVLDDPMCDIHTRTNTHAHTHIYNNKKQLASDLSSSHR